MSRVAIALVHYPVLDRERDIITTAITNLDLHDIARTARTYGVARLLRRRIRCGAARAGGARAGTLGRRLGGEAHSHARARAPAAPRRGRPRGRVRRPRRPRRDRRLRRRARMGRTRRPSSFDERSRAHGARRSDGAAPVRDGLGAWRPRFSIEADLFLRPIGRGEPVRATTTSACAPRAPSCSIACSARGAASSAASSGSGASLPVGFDEWREHDQSAGAPAREFDERDSSGGVAVP